MQGDTGPGPVANRRPPTPRWVKVFGIIGVGVLLLVVVILVTGKGGPGVHGPGRHQPSSGGTPSANHTTSGTHSPPPTHHTVRAIGGTADWAMGNRSGAAITPLALPYVS